MTPKYQLVQTPNGMWRVLKASTGNWCCGPMSREEAQALLRCMSF